MPYSVPCCLDSAPFDRDVVIAVLQHIGVTYSSFELSCQLRTQRRGLTKAAKQNSKPRASTIWFRSWKACGRVGTRKGGRDEPKDNLWWTKRQHFSDAGQPLDEQKTRKLKISSVEASNRRRQKRQEQRDDN